VRGGRGGRRAWSAAALAWAVVTTACIEGEAGLVELVPGGDAARGRRLLWSYGCGECHVIPGAPEADGTVGPPLEAWAARRYIAGTLWNTPENLIRWILDPEGVEPGTAMPDLDVDTADARDMAAYLFTLRPDDPLGPPHIIPVGFLKSLMPGGGAR